MLGWKLSIPGAAYNFDKQIDKICPIIQRSGNLETSHSLLKSILYPIKQLIKK
jgi:hypothetical protein